MCGVSRADELDDSRVAQLQQPVWLSLAAAAVRNGTGSRARRLHRFRRAGAASPGDSPLAGERRSVRLHERSSAFRPDIEGLRGIAVLMVVAYHCALPGFSRGLIGVDIFFVLSGYLITGLLVAEGERTGRIDLPQFYARRVRRLLPAAALVLVATIALAVFVASPSEMIGAGRAARATAFYLSNIFFGINENDYFAVSVKSDPLLHTWSLSVEEQFYMLWPLLVVLGSRYGARDGDSSRCSRSSRSARWRLASG
ncbi:MAG: acyltransferase [Chloroflexia bacterium]